MRNIALLFIILLWGCSDSHSKKEIVAGGETIKFFDDAESFSPSWSQENTLVFHVINEPDNLHPTNGISVQRAEIFFYTQRCLMYIDYKTQTVSPGLVKSLPEISSDSLSYTYKLRNNISWDNGSQLSPEDILFTAKVFRCPLTNNPAVKNYWNNVKNIVPGNDHSFTIYMYKKNFQNISFLTGFPVLQRSFHDPGNVLNSFSLEQFNDTMFDPVKFPELVKWANEYNDDSAGRLPEKLNGLGMYKLKEWQAGQFITLIKKENHWTKNSDNYLEHAYPDKIVFQLNKDEASQILDFRNQKLDASTNCSVNAFLQLSGEEDFKKNYNSALLPTFNYTYIGFNEKPGKIRKPLFTDASVRRAIALLTPVDDIMKIAYRDYSKQCRRMVSNVSPMKKDFNNSLKPLEHNEKAAKKLLDRAGWKDTNGDGILDKTIDGTKISFSADLNYLTTSPEWKSMAVYITEQFAKAGIQVNAVPMDLNHFLEKAKTHDFDLILGSWGGTGLQEDYTQLWHTSSWSSHGSNYSGFGNEQSDFLIEKMKVELNDSIRTTLSFQLQQMIYDDQPFVFLYSSMRRNIIHRRFGNGMIFAERPGILCNNLRLLSTTGGITIRDQDKP